MLVSLSVCLNIKWLLFIMTMYQWNNGVLQQFVATFTLIHTKDNIHGPPLFHPIWQCWLWLWIINKLFKEFLRPEMEVKSIDDYLNRKLRRCSNQCIKIGEFFGIGGWKCLCEFLTWKDFVYCDRFQRFAIQVFFPNSRYLFEISLACLIFRLIH